MSPSWLAGWASVAGRPAAQAQVVKVSEVGSTHRMGFAGLGVSFGLAVFVQLYYRAIRRIDPPQTALFTAATAEIGIWCQITRLSHERRAEESERRVQLALVPAPPYRRVRAQRGDHEWEIWSSIRDKDHFQ